MRREITSLSDLVAGSPAQGHTPSYGATGWRSRPPEALDIRDFGAVLADSSTHTAAIAAALDAHNAAGGATYAASSRSGYFDVNGPAVYIPPGAWTWNPSGTGYDRGASASALFSVVGAGPSVSRIVIASGKWFIDTARAINQLRFHGLQFQGGNGALSHSASGNNIGGMVRIEDCDFIDYTVCALGTCSTNFPYWSVRNCQFRGSREASIGIAHAGDAAGGTIHHCEFDDNRYHLKLGTSGLGWRVTDSDFIRFGAHTNPNVDIWVVPAASSGSDGQDFHVSGCKFGNEQLQAGDYRILYADQATTVTNFLDTPHSASASSGYIRAHTIMRNDFSWTTGCGGVPMVYSTTDRISNGVYGPNQCLGDDFTYALGLLDGASANADRYANTNVWGPFVNRSTGREILAPAYPLQKPWYGVLHDPLGSWQDAAAFSRAIGSGADPEYVSVFSTALGSWTLSSVTRTTGQADMTGGLGAVELAFSSGGIATATFTAAAAGTPTWLELDLAAGSGTPVPAVEVRLQDFSSGPIRVTRRIAVGSGWRRYRVGPFHVPSTTGRTLSVRPSPGTFSGGGTQTLLIARVAGYHAREPVNIGPVHLGAGAARLFTGTGTPESVVTAPVGSLYVRTDGGASTTLYVKESGTGNTGWRAV